MNTVSIIILILTLGITIIPFTGKLWLSQKAKFQIFWRGKIFVFCASCSLLLGAIQINKESKNQTKRDNYQKNTLFNTEIILDSLEISMYNIEQKLIRIDSLNYKLDSIEIKTIASIENRDKILSDFNKLNIQLQKLYNQQALNIKENSPIVGIFNGLKWIKEKGIYKIVVELSNEGGRTATDVKISTWFFIAKKSGDIINHKLLSTDLISDDVLPPRNISNKRMQYKFPNFPKSSLLDSLSRGYVLINYSYKDFVTDSIYYNNEGFIWRGVESDGLEWVSMPLSTYNKLNEYLIANKIEIKKSSL